MLDFSHISNVQSGADVQVFCNPGQWQTWTKPRGVSSVQITNIGGGSGGGGGFSGASGTARGGGGGGAPGGATAHILAARSLPDMLYIYVGSGGSGGGANVAGSAGGLSFVSLYPSGGHPGAFSWSASSTPGGAGAGTASAGGAAGTVSAVGNFSVGIMGPYASNAARPGTIGGAPSGAVGASSASYGANISGGTGGAGCTTTDFAGGISFGGHAIPALSGGLAGGGKGSDGYELTMGGILSLGPSIFLPGTGGGSNNLGVGGAGGNGATGCGGGGGGAGVTGGAGGRGGNGLVIMTCW